MWLFWLSLSFELLQSNLFWWYIIKVTSWWHQGHSEGWKLHWMFVIPILSIPLSSLQLSQVCWCTNNQTRFKVGVYCKIVTLTLWLILQYQGTQLGVFCCARWQILLLLLYMIISLNCRVIGILINWCPCMSLLVEIHGYLFTIFLICCNFACIVDCGPFFNFPQKCFVQDIIVFSILHI